MNKDLYGRVFKLDDRVVTYINDTLLKCKNTNVIGYTRAKNLVKNRTISYSLAKRIKNYFDTYKGNSLKDITYHLNGGDLMKTYLKSLLSSEREKLKQKKYVERSAGLENRFRKKHQKKSLKPTKVNNNNVKLNRGYRGDLFEENNKQMKNEACLGIMFNQDKHILLLRRSADDDWMGGKWALPGGGIQAGEEKHEALLREVFEETGINVPRILYANSYNDSNKTQCHVYLCFLPTEFGDVKLNSEHSEYKWCSIEELAELKDCVPNLYVMVTSALETAIREAEKDGK